MIPGMNLVCCLRASMYVSEAGKLDCCLNEFSIVVLLLAGARCNNIWDLFKLLNSHKPKNQQEVQGTRLHCISFHSLICMLFHVHSPQSIILIENFNKFTKTTYANINRGRREWRFTSAILSTATCPIRYGLIFPPKWLLFLSTKLCYAATIIMRYIFPSFSMAES